MYFIRSLWLKTILTIISDKPLKANITYSTRTFYLKWNVKIKNIYFIMYCIIREIWKFFQNTCNREKSDNFLKENNGSHLTILYFSHFKYGKWVIEFEKNY